MKYKIGTVFFLFEREREKEREREVNDKLNCPISYISTAASELPRFTSCSAWLIYNGGRLDLV